MIGNLLFLSIVGFCVALPFESLLPWLSRYLREANERVERTSTRAKLSKATMLNGLIHGLNLLKGYVPLYLSYTYFTEDYHLIMTALLLLACHTWSPFNGFRPKGHMGMILVGMYGVINPWYLLWFPVIWALSLLILNSIPVGLIASILIMFFVVWATASSPIFVIVNFVIFIVIFFSLISVLFDHFEGKKMTLRRSFDLR